VAYIESHKFESRVIERMLQVFDNQCIFFYGTISVIVQSY